MPPSAITVPAAASWTALSSTSAHSSSLFGACPSRSTSHSACAVVSSAASFRLNGGPSFGALVALRADAVARHPVGLHPGTFRIVVEVDLFVDEPFASQRSVPDSGTKTIGRSQKRTIGSPMLDSQAPQRTAGVLTTSSVAPVRSSDGSSGS